MRVSGNSFTGKTKPGSTPHVTAWESEETTFNHGIVFLGAFEEGLLCIHAKEMDEAGPEGIASLIMDRIGTEGPVYLSLDIDVLDPAFAPGTDLTEPGD